MTYYEICMNFLVYSFIGWCIEVAFHAITMGKVVNRGFLNGPVCPVYGFGMLAVLAMANSLEKTDVTNVNVGVLFIGGVILTTLIELVAGWILEMHFHTRWWDYSKEKFNFKGYICLRFSILWGIGVVLAVKVIHPLLEKYTTHMINPKIGWPILFVFYICLLVDWIVTISIVNGMNKRFKELDEIQKSLLVPSDKMSEIIATGTLETAQRVQEGKVQVALGKMELRDRLDDAKDTVEDVKADVLSNIGEKTYDVMSNLGEKKESVLSNINDVKETIADTKAARDAEQAKRRKALEEKYYAIYKNFGMKRLLKAFPQMRWDDNEKLIPDLKEKIEKIVKERKI